MVNILVIGNGSREHAICWKLRSSSSLTALYCAPGNPGTASIAQNIPIAVDDVLGLCDVAIEKKIDLTIVGPELPLSLGIVDAFQSRGLKIFGPSVEAAKLESSKSFAKEIMQAAGVPTAACKVFSKRDEAIKYLEAVAVPVVLKADGLASGKGVFVCNTREEVISAISQLYSELGTGRLVVEDFIAGHEVTFIVATDGTRVVPLVSSHDYKRLLDGQQGPNTGGMGAVSPSSHLPHGHEEHILSQVIEPVLAEMRKRKTPFVGFLYAGLMISHDGTAKVLEFNARLGDPECQVIMRRLDTDLITIVQALIAGSASPIPKVQWKNESAVGIVLAASGYPHTVRKGDSITGIEFSEMLPNCVVFQGGTALDQNKRLITSGGRVLTVTALGEDVESAAQAAYKAADMIQFRGRQLRRDVGK